MFAGVGERSREGNDLYHEMSDAGVIDQEDISKSKVALVYGQMNEPPGARMRVALSGLTMAEYFRDEMGQDVLLFVDNIFRFSQAGFGSFPPCSVVSPLCRWLPTYAVRGNGHPAGAYHIHEQRFHHLFPGRLRSSRRPYRPPLPPTPSPTSTQPSFWSALLRNLAFTRAVDPLASVSNALSPEIVGEEHFRVARGVQEVLQSYKDLQGTSSPFFGLGRAFPRAEANRFPGPQDSEVPFPALSRGGSLHRRSRRICFRQRYHKRLSHDP